MAVQCADLKEQAASPPEDGIRYTVNTRVHHAISPLHGGGVLRGTNVHNIDASSQDGGPRLLFTSEPSWACDWTYGRRFKGLVMGTPRTNVIATVLIAGPRAQTVAERFKSIEGSAAAHAGLGLAGEVHVAVQDVILTTGELVVVRAGAQHREDMHRLLHECMLPLKSHLGVSPYARMLKAEKTGQLAPLLSGAQGLAIPPKARDRTAIGGSRLYAMPSDLEPKLQVQHATVHA